MSGKAKFRLLLLLILAGVCGYVGVLVFRERDPMPPILKAEQLVTREGPDLEKAGRFKEAATKYDQANILLEHALKRLNGPHGMDEATMRAVVGKVYKMKAWAIRDKYFALAADSGKPIEETLDTATGKTYRNVLAIPDAKDREEAAGNIRGAAIHFLPKDYDVQVEALRLELMAKPMQWDSIEKYATAILNLKEDDSRAKYLLARYEFEQPQTGKNIPTHSSKRSPERVRRALKLVEEIRADPNFPVWRTEFLKAQIHRWSMRHYEDKREKDYFEQMDILDRLLLDEFAGALARIRRGEHLKNLSKWDADGVVGLHGLASDLAIEQIRKRRLQDSSSLARIYQDTLALAKSKIEANDPAFPRSLMIGTLLNVMSKSQTVLSTQDKELWQEGIEFLRPVIREEFKNDRCEPYQVALMAEILMREAFLRRADSKRREELRLEAKKWLDDGLKYGRDHNLSNQQMLPFNLLAANVTYFTAGKREDIAPFVLALQASRDPEAQATALVLDGAYDEFEGRLEKARFKLEQAVKITGGNEEIRAHSALANVYMAMGMPDHALVSLNYLQGVYDRYDELSNLEKEWVAQFLRSPQDFYGLLVLAHLDNAKKQIIRYFRANPRAKTFPFELVKDSEERVQKYFKRELPRVTGQGITARCAWINYLVSTRRRDQAQREWDDLARDYADRFELLTTSVILKQAELNEDADRRKRQQIPAEVDKIIQEFITRNPSNISAKLFFSTWLSQTGRTDQSLAYLKKLADESEMTPEMRRVFAAVIMSHNQNVPAMRLLKHLPRDPQIDDVLINLSRSIDKQQQDVRSALTRHESVGLTRVMKAEDLFAAGDFEKAAESFAQLLDFYRTKSLAQRGLMRSLLALTNKDAEAALSLNRQFIADYPYESIFYLTAAFIHLALEDVGSPTDDWAIRRSMGSALNEWERFSMRDGVPNPIGIPLTRAEFWFHAGRIDVARAELQRGLNHDRQNTAVLAACAYMILDDPAREPRAELREYVDELLKLNPDLAVNHHLAARVEEHEGNWAKAIALYEQMLPKFPKDHASYSRLVDLLDMTREYDKGVRWARIWRKELPTDLLAMAAEVRFLTRKNDLDGARRAGEEFVAESVNRATKLSQLVKNPDEKVQKERQALFIENARWRAELDLARGFYLGGSIEEAERRFRQLPKEFQNGQVSQEILGEILLKKEKWKEAEVVFDNLFRANRQNLVAANNLSYLLAVHLNQPEKARDILREALKGRKFSQSLQSSDRLKPEFLATIGAVYMKLERPELAKEMLEFFKPALQRYPNDPRIQLYVGYSMELAGEYGRAEDYYNTAIRKSAHPVLSELQRNNLLRDAETSLQRLQTKVRTVTP